MKREQMTFCMLKTEARLLGKRPYIERRLAEEGFEIVGQWIVRPGIRDICQMYPGTLARLGTLLRMPFLFGARVYWVRREDGIRAMDIFKKQIRRELWSMFGARGNYLHAPDCFDELCAHSQILAGAKTESVLVEAESNIQGATV